MQNISGVTATHLPDWPHYANIALLRVSVKGGSDDDSLSDVQPVCMENGGSA